MKSVAITDFKARCLTLLEDVARTGEPLAKIEGKRKTEVAPPCFDRGEYLTLQGRAQAADGCFNFRKFG